MRYSIDIIDKARDEIQNRRNNALKTRQDRISELKIKAPEIAKLAESLAQTNIQLCQAIIGGGGNTSELIERIKNENLQTQKNIKSFLSEFGYPSDYLEIPYTCPKCKDNGTIMGKNCGCYEELLMKYSVEELNKSCKIALRDFGEFKLEYYPVDKLPSGHTIRDMMLEVFNFCFEYANNFSNESPSLILNGNTGLGKTFLSSAIAKKVTEKGYSVVFDSVSNILRCIENERFGRSNGDTMSVVLNADLVILDDLGSECINSFSGSILYEIINGRMNQNLPVIVSTNFSNNELDSKYNERIISRISSFLPVHFEGKDIRQIIIQNSY
ncbi:MAG: DNA replication protein DnaC [Ruminococcus sp.]|nr:DNA replication protein DnaC [Ruminococcus sp.]